MRTKIGVGLAAAALIWPGLALADDLGEPGSSSGDRAAEDLRLLVDDLREEVSLLRRKVEVQEEAATARGPTPIVGAGPDGFFLRSPDRAYEIRFRGYTNFDGRYFTEEKAGNTDTWLFRRVRPIVEGTLAGVLDFRIMPDFAGSALSLQDAYVNLRYLDFANIQAGKYKSPFGLERLQSATALMFPERALPTNLVPNRDLGLMVHGNLGEGLVQYQLAFMNGVVDGGSADVDINDAKDIGARLFFHPFQNFTQAWLSGLGVGGSFGWGATGSGTTLPTYRTAGQSVFFSYITTPAATATTLDEHRLRWSPQLYYYWGPFGLLGEYVSSTTGVTRLGNDELLENTAWQLAASYVLTGENASFRGVVPRKGLSLGEGTFGALELAARYNQLDIDPDAFDEGFANPSVSAERARAFGVGVNWYLNGFIKLALAYERTFFENGGGTLADVENRNDESVLFMRTQLAF